jgi:hypothetical protein
MDLSCEFFKVRMRNNAGCQARSARYSSCPVFLSAADSLLRLSSASDAALARSTAERCASRSVRSWSTLLGRSAIINVLINVLDPSSTAGKAPSRVATLRSERCALRRNKSSATSYASVQSIHLTDLQGSHLNTVAPLTGRPTGGMLASSCIGAAHFSQFGGGTRVMASAGSGGTAWSDKASRTSEQN